MVAKRDELYQKEAMLLRELEQVRKEREELHQEEVQLRRMANEGKMRFLRDNKDFILSLLQHTRNSCVEGARVNEDRGCPKCRLQGLLDDEWENDYEVEFSIDITEIS